MSVSAADNSRVTSRLDAAFFERLFEGAGLAVFVCDVQGRIRAWNSIGELLLRANNCWHESAQMSDVLPEADRTLFRECFQSCVRSEQPIEMRTRVGDPTGDPADYAVWFTPIPDESGSGLGGISVWFHDITERVALRQSMRKVERLSSLGNMSGAVAHHYNNLLCGIATSLEYALRSPNPSAMRQALGRTADAVARATQLTQQLLAFAAADHRCYDQADLTETVLLYFDQHEKRLAEHGVTLDLHWAPLSRGLSVPREHILIILSNLVENAIDAMGGAGVLRVELEAKDERSVRLSVLDTGPGMKSDQLEHVFEPFYTTKGELGAGPARRAGMGLAVVWGLVTEMRGTITASNVPGGGARFDIVLPYPEAAADAAAPGPGPPAGA